MNLAGTFYNTISFDINSKGFYATMELFPNHPVYKGHFPMQPVVPGVFTLAIVRECAAAVLGRDVEYAEIKECKFISALQPQDEMEITLDFSISDGEGLNGIIMRNNDIVLKLKAKLK